VVSSDDEEEGAALHENLAQFISTWVCRWPTRPARSMIDEFMDVGAEDRERLRYVVAVGVESASRLAEAILAEATRVVRRRETIGGRLQCSARSSVDCWRQRTGCCVST